MIAVAAHRWFAAMRPSDGATPVVAAVLDGASADPGSLDSAADAIVSNDPFRLANTAASVRYSATAPAPVGFPSSVGRFTAPAMTLRATAGGPPWQALIEGIPGQPRPTLVRAGAVFEKLLIRAITRDSVVIRGADSTWTLGFPRSS
jgi:hypothetical protein